MYDFPVYLGLQLRSTDELFVHPLPDSNISHDKLWQPNNFDRPTDPLHSVPCSTTLSITEERTVAL